MNAKSKFTLSGGLLFPCFIVISVYGTRIELAIYHYIAFFLAGGLTGFCVGCMKDKYRIISQELKQKNRELTSELKGRIQAENELRMSQKTAHALLNASGEAALLIDLTGIVLNVNQLGADRFGGQIKDLIGKPARNFVSNQLEASWKTKIAQAIQERQPVRFEDSHDRLIFDTNVYPILNRQGYVEKIALFSRDISVRKHAEAKIIHQAANLDAIFNNVPNVLALVTKNAKIENINHKGVGFFGKKKQDAIGKLSGDVFNCLNAMNQNDCGQSPDCPQCPLRKRILDTMETGNSHTEEEGELTILHNGKKRTLNLLITTVLLQIGGSERILLSLTDVTDLKYAENESAHFHKGLFENSPIAHYIQDFSEVAARVDILKQKGVTDLAIYLRERPEEVETLADCVKLSQTNKAAIALYKAGSSQELLQSFRKLIRPNDWQHFIDQVVALTSEKDHYTGEARSFDLKGNQLDVILKKAVIHREVNGLSKILVSITDVTQLHRTNREKRQLEKQLLHAQKMETIGTLAGGIAHDFNNILFPITGYAELLLSDIPETSPFREYINEIYTGAMRATDLVKQILTFARQESHELTLVKIQYIIQEALKLIRVTIPTTIEIKKSIDNGCGAIKADPTQVHQILMNLLTNAFHAMEETGGILKVSLMPVELGAIDLMNSNMTPGPYVRLIVSDTGMGMTKEITHKIFDPFFTTKEKGKGTGMGLSVTHGIVNAIGGAIQVYSVPGKGTEFKLYFPVEKTMAYTEYAPEKESLKGGKEHILLIDDEPSVLELERDMLTRLGYRVSCRISSLEALEAFGHTPQNYDLVISDVAMPKLSGDRLAAKIIAIRPDMPVLLCTGFSGTVSEKKMTGLGVKGFLMKPIIFKDLATAVRSALS